MGGPVHVIVGNETGSEKEDTSEVVGVENSKLEAGKKGAAVELSEDETNCVSEGSTAG